MARDDDIPAYSSDLIEWLVDNVKSPSWPMTANGARTLDAETIRLGCFQAGARALVEQLVAWQQETEENHGQPVDDDDSDSPQLSFPGVFDNRGRVAEIASPVRVVGDPTGPVLDHGSETEG